MGDINDKFGIGDAIKTKNIVKQQDESTKTEDDSLVETTNKNKKEDIDKQQDESAKTEDDSLVENAVESEDIDKQKD